ncbi:hypothetical protein SKAU_G00401130 [Synaphobranchus kaupii]|uniref:TNFR-Cys domain-containing protein n=1 Tax=Synaphobranchus kaupii TaxID=118154 RepID=A0A9Q1E916_SYNKA|nr:hypothetical protein SKAU_G00401130 [Synaphobranchus kaupii]
MEKNVLTRTLLYGRTGYSEQEATINHEIIPAACLLLHCGIPGGVPAHVPAPRPRDLQGVPVRAVPAWHGGPAPLRQGRAHRVRPLPRGHFSEHWHWGKACQRCTSVCKEQQLVRRECDRTHDRLCECAPGYHLEVEFCIRHTPCPPGSGVAVLGTPESDTECERCAKGSFSSSLSATEPCVLHRDCSKLGKRTMLPGTAEKNTVCENDDRGLAPECFQQDLQCHTDVILCEEVILQFLSSLHFLSALPLGTVAASLPGRKLDSRTVEQVTAMCGPKQQVLQLLRLWREMNRDQGRLFGITKVGVNHCEKAVSRCSAFRSLTLSDLQMMMDSLPGVKVREEDIRAAMGSCEPQQYLLKVLYLWKTRNGEQDLAKVLEQSLRELRPRGASPQLLRSVRRLNTLFSTSSIRKLYKNIFLKIILDKC